MANSVYDALVSGNRQGMYEAQLEKLAKAIDMCESMRDLPALTKRFNEVKAEYEAYMAANDEKKSTPLAQILAAANE